MNRSSKYLSYGLATIVSAIAGIGIAETILNNKKYESKVTPVVGEVEISVPELTNGIPVRGDVEVDLIYLDENGNVVHKDSRSYRPSELGMNEANNNLRYKVYEPNK